MPRFSSSTGGRSLRSIFAWLVGLLAIGLIVAWALAERRAERTRRAVAEIRDLGGHVQRENPFRQTRRQVQPAQLAAETAAFELPPGAFGVSFVEFRSDDGRLLPAKTRPLMDGDLLPLAELSSLRWLALDGRRLSDRGLDPLRELTELDTLWLGNLGNRDDWMIHLARMPRLTQLYLPYARVTDEGVKLLEGLTRLETLDLSGTLVTDAGLARLFRLVRLKRLWLPDTMITDAGLKHVRALRQLESIDLSGVEVTDAGMVSLKNLVHLKTLRLPYTQIGAAGVAELQSLTELQELDLAGTNVDDNALAHLRKLANLRRLSLEGTRVSDEGMRHLAGLTRLESLVLSATRVSVAGLEQLASLQQLRVLRIDETNCSLSGAARLLTERQNRDIENALETLADTQRNATGQLISLDLSKIRVTDEGLAQVARADALQWLVLAGAEVTDAGLAHLKNLNRLALLDLTGTRVSDAGLPLLVGLPQLRTLHVGDTQVSEQGAKRFQETFPGRIRIYTRNLTQRQAVGSSVEVVRGTSVLRQLKAVSGLRFVPMRLRVPPGRRIALTFKNVDINMQHNFVLAQNDRLDAIGEASTQQAVDPLAIARHYVPDDPGVLCHSPILNPGDECTVYFESPQRTGAYPFVCTFPGHWKVMRGVLLVAETDAMLPDSPKPPPPERKFVKMWTLQDLAGTSAPTKGRSFERGREMFRVAGCDKCHVIAGEGTRLGPDLTDVRQRYQGTRLLQQILEPSREIAKEYRTYSVLTTDGETIAGLILEENAATYRILPNPLDPEKTRVVEKSNIERIAPADVSTMPKGLLMTLERDEILDLMYFLEAGGKPGPSQIAE